MFKKLLLLLFAFSMVQGSLYAQLKVSGKVTDNTNFGIPGVSIVVKGTAVGTSTDVNGDYSVAVPKEGVSIIFSYVGLVSQEITIGNKSTINVTLLEDEKLLNEVVVVGYGQMKRADLTSAQTSISSKDIEKTINTTIEQAIQGRSAGVYVTQNSGQPGGGISVNIRGVNSINGTNEPLYVIDGIQIPGQTASFGSNSSSNPLAGLNPSDIESIEVLQGPSATAIYGSRATNGVLLITTKKGKSGEAKITYGLQYSIQTPPKPLQVMNLQEYASMNRDYHDIAGGRTPLEFLDPSLLSGGSALIIGSAAGVAAMGLDKIEFFWYVKKISWLALIGYFAGIGVFLLQSMI